MTWVRIDDRMPEHEKVARLSDAAFRVHISAMCLAARNDTEGFVSDGVCRQYAWTKRIAELVAAGVWEPGDGGHWIHDFLEYNPTRRESEDRRAQNHDAKVAGGKARAAGAQRAGGRFTSSTPAGEPAEPPAENEQATSPHPLPHTPIVEKQDQIPPTPQRFEVVERDPVWSRLCAVHGELTTRLHPPPTEERQFETWVNAGASEADIESALAQIKAWETPPERPWPAFKEALGSRLASRAIGGSSGTHGGASEGTAARAGAHAGADRRGGVRALSARSGDDLGDFPVAREWPPRPAESGGSD